MSICRIGIGLVLRDNGKSGPANERDAQEPFRVGVTCVFQDVHLTTNSVE